MTTFMAQSSTLALDAHQLGGLGFGALIVGVILAFVVLFIGALISILGSELSGGMKIAWVIFAFIAPFLGSLLWFVVGRSDARRRSSTPAVIVR